MARVPLLRCSGDLVPGLLDSVYIDGTQSKEPWLLFKKAVELIRSRTGKNYADARLLLEQAMVAQRVQVSALGARPCCDIVQVSPNLFKAPFKSPFGEVFWASFQTDRILIHEAELCGWLEELIPDLTPAPTLPVPAVAPDVERETVLEIPAQPVSETPAASPDSAPPSETGKRSSGRKPNAFWATEVEPRIKQLFVDNGSLSDDNPEWRYLADVEKAIGGILIDIGEEAAESTIRDYAKKYIEKFDGRSISDLEAEGR
jgi:hypothetical protein